MSLREARSRSASRAGRSGPQGDAPGAKNVWRKNPA